MSHRFRRWLAWRIMPKSTSDPIVIRLIAGPLYAVRKRPKDT